MAERVVLAYSGGLDTSVGIGWVREQTGAEVIALATREFDLLAFLATDVGAVRTRTEILENVWDAHWYGPTKTVDAHVASLRKKLGSHEWIQAVRGVGFRLEPPA